MKKLGLSIISLLAVLFSAWWIMQSLEDKKPPLLQAEVVRGDIRQVIRGVGYLEAEKVETLSAMLPGKIKRLLVEPGKNVKKGDILFEIESQTFEQDYRLLKAKYRQAKKEFKKIQEEKKNSTSQTESYNALEKIKKQVADLENEVKNKDELLSKGFISQKDYDDSKNRLDAAKMDEEIAYKRYQEVVEPLSTEDVELKKAELSKMRTELKTFEKQASSKQTKTEFDAVIIEVMKKENESVAAEDAVLTLVESNKPWVIQSMIFESEVTALSKGLAATVKVPGIESRLDAMIDEISLVAKTSGASRKFPVRLKLKEPFQGPARLGMGVDFEILIQEKQKILKLPIQFVEHVPDKGAGVWINNGSGLSFQKISVGISDETFVEISGGLSEGQKVFLPDQGVKSPLS